MRALAVELCPGLIGFERSHIAFVATHASLMSRQAEQRPCVLDVRNFLKLWKFKHDSVQRIRDNYP